MTLAQSGVPVLPKPVFELCGVSAPSFAPLSQGGQIVSSRDFLVLKSKLNRLAEEKYL